MNWMNTTNKNINSVDDFELEQQRRRRVMMMMMRKRGEMIDQPVARETTLSQEAWLYQRQQEREQRRSK